MKGADQARQRSHLAYLAVTERGLFTSDDEPIFGIQNRSIAVWSRSEDHELVLTESDIEGWIFYTSLCREVQSAGPLRLSVADRRRVNRARPARVDHGNFVDLGMLWMVSGCLGSSLEVREGR